MREDCERRVRAVLSRVRSGSQAESSSPSPLLCPARSALRQTALSQARGASSTGGELQLAGCWYHTTPVLASGAYKVDGMGWDRVSCRVGDRSAGGKRRSLLGGRRRIGRQQDETSATAQEALGASPRCRTQSKLKSRHRAAGSVQQEKGTRRRMYVRADYMHVNMLEVRKVVIVAE